jgi:hypothetical protein
VGQPVAVRVEMSGPDATLALDGAPAGAAYVTGSPGEEGSLGFLHYYNYDFDYGGFQVTTPEGDIFRPDLGRPLDAADWALRDPTYSAAEGCLRASDGEPLELSVTTFAEPGRQVIRAAAEGAGVPGQSPLEGHLILRDTPADPAALSVFAAVIEATRQRPRVTDARPLELRDSRGLLVPHSTALALLVTATEADGAPRRDVIYSATEPTAGPFTAALPEGTLSLSGPFAFTTLSRPSPGALAVGASAVEGPGGGLRAPGVLRGTVLATDPDGPAIVVRPDAGPRPEAGALPGQKLRVLSPGNRHGSVYTITAAEALTGGDLRLALNMPLLLARGVVATTDADQGAFASDTPIMKLRHNPGLFDGKQVCSLADGRSYRLASATEEALRPADPGALSSFAPGSEFANLDVGPDDRVEVVTSASVPAGAPLTP